MSKRTKGFLLVLISAVLWGFGGIAGQLVYSNSDIETPWLIGSRMLFSGVVITLIAFLKDGKRVFDLFKNKRDLAIFIFYAILGNWLVQYSYFEGIMYSNAATITLLQYLAPSMVLIVYAFKNRKMPSFLEILCVIGALIGLFLISTHGNINKLQISAIALIWGIVSAASMTIYNISPINLLKKYGTYNVVGLSMLLGGIITVIFFMPYSNDYTITAKVWGYVLFILVFGTTVPFTGYLAGIKIVGSTTGSILANIEPLTSAVFSVLFLNMPVTFFDFIGFCLILGVAVALTVFDKK